MSRWCPGGFGSVLRGLFPGSSRRSPGRVPVVSRELVVLRGLFPVSSPVFSRACPGGVAGVLIRFPGLFSRFSPASVPGFSGVRPAGWFPPGVFPGVFVFSLVGRP